jgi:hypothetical protein
VKEVYIVATEEAEPLGPEAIGEAFETDEVTVELDEAPGSFLLRSAEAEIRGPVRGPGGAPGLDAGAPQRQRGGPRPAPTSPGSLSARVRHAPRQSADGGGLRGPLVRPGACSRSGKASWSTPAPSRCTRRRTSGRSPSWTSTSGTTSRCTRCRPRPATRLSGCTPTGWRSSGSTTWRSSSSPRRTCSRRRASSTSCAPTSPSAKDPRRESRWRPATVRRSCSSRRRRPGTASCASRRTPSRVTRASTGPSSLRRGVTPPPSCSGPTAAGSSRRTPADPRPWPPGGAAPAGVQGALPSPGAHGAAHLPGPRAVRDAP